VFRQVRLSGGHSLTEPDDCDIERRVAGWDCRVDQEQREEDETMTGRLSGKTALVTGAGSGVGYAVTKLFAAEGARVAAIARRDEHLAHWDGVENVTPIRADLTNPADIDRMVDEAQEHFDGLDIVANIAGIHDHHTLLEDTTDDMWHRVINTNLLAPFQISRRAIPGMVQRGSGVILNFGSLASVRGLHGPSYNAAKAGLIGLTTSIAVGYGSKGIRCNLIQSGGVKSNITATSGGEQNLHPEGHKLFQDIVAGYPLKWWCYPEDVAPAVLFLCSDDARHVNGAIVPVDGGMSAL
jgi:NAD(P)-dependent dehydrogenase (short-subunit alcohol dehydrogenase family)